MSLRTPFIAATCAALATALLRGFVAVPQEKPARGARVAIVAYHDSRLLTLCPVFGKQVVATSVWTSRMEAKVSVAYPPTGQQSIGLHFDPEGSRRVMLPMPAGSSPGGSSGQPPALSPRELDRLARDVGVERRLADQLRARNFYTLVDSPADADFVLVAESIYIPMSAATAAGGRSAAPNVCWRHRRRPARELEAVDSGSRGAGRGLPAARRQRGGVVVGKRLERCCGGGMGTSHARRPRGRRRPRSRRGPIRSATRDARDFDRTSRS